MTMQPINNRVIVKPKKEEKTAGGIYLPESEEKSTEGTVVAIPQMDKCPVTIGDRVLYEAFAGTEITINGEKLLIIKVEDILIKMY
ncbi:MAG: co-chaperone GroES [Candidatus Woesearchaeota archaeon]|jgi:chaperonin GroES